MYELERSQFAFVSNKDVTQQGPEMELLLRERRCLWLAAICQNDLMEKILQYRIGDAHLYGIEWQSEQYDYMKAMNA